MKRSLVCFVALAGALTFRGPAEVSANDIDYLKSSMKAWCVTESCSQITFLLDVREDVLLSSLYLRSKDVNVWKFGGLHMVLDQFGTDVTADWMPNTVVRPDSITLTSTSATSAAEPVTFIVDMIQPPSGTEEDIDGLMWYWAGGTQPANGDELFSTDGFAMVTPEPVSLLLVATGMLGMAAVRRRRRRHEPGVRPDDEHGRGPPAD